MEAVARMVEGLNGQGKSVRDSPVPAQPKNSRRRRRRRDEKDSEMTLNTSNPGLCFLGHFGPRSGNAQTPLGRDAKQIQNSHWSHFLKQGATVGFGDCGNYIQKFLVSPTMLTGND